MGLGAADFLGATFWVLAAEVETLVGVFFVFLSFLEGDESEAELADLDLVASPALEVGLGLAVVLVLPGLLLTEDALEDCERDDLLVED